jgi:hypothetical protein
MPLARLPVTELAVVAVPSTRNVIDDDDELPDPPALPGAVGLLLPLPPPQAIVIAARQAANAHTHRAASRITCPFFEKLRAVRNCVITASPPAAK